MVDAIIEGLNRVIEQERVVRGVSASGFFKVHSTSTDSTFGGLTNTGWVISYIRPQKQLQVAFSFRLVYNKRRDDYLATIDMMLTTQIINFVKSDNWEKVINGEDIQPVPDTSY